MAFCGYCGSQMPDELKFCTKCGKPLKSLASNDAQDNIVYVNNARSSSDFGSTNTDQRIVSNASSSNMSYAHTNNTTGFQYSGPQYTPEEVSALGKQLHKEKRTQRLYEASWIIGLVMLIASFIDYYSDPPIFTIFLSGVILVGGLFVFKNSLKGKVIAGIAMLIAVYCIICGFHQGARLGFFITPDRQTTNTVATNSSSSSNNTSNSSSNSGASSNSSSSSSSSSSSTVDPDLKKFLDSYEDFMDDYVAFMKKYTSDPNNAISMMSDYMEMLQKYEEFAEKADRYNPDTMSAADAAYYLEVMTRIEKKMLELY